MKFKRGDRVMLLPEHHKDFSSRSSKWREIKYPVGTVMEYEGGSNIGVAFEEYGGHHNLPIKYVILESIYNSPLYKALL